MSIAPFPPNKSPVVTRPPKQNNLWLILLTILQCITLGLVAVLLGLNWHPVPTPTPTSIISPTATLSPEPVTETPLPTETPIPAQTTPAPTDTALPTLTPTPECKADDYPAQLHLVYMVGGETIASGDQLSGEVGWRYENRGGCELSDFSITPGSPAKFYRGEQSFENLLESNAKLQSGQILVIVQLVSAKNGVTLPGRQLTFKVNGVELELPLDGFVMPNKEGDLINTPTPKPTPTVSDQNQVAGCDLGSYPDAVVSLETPVPGSKEESDDPQNNEIGMTSVAFKLKNTGNCEIKIVNISKDKDQRDIRVYDFDQIIPNGQLPLKLKQKKDEFIWKPGDEIVFTIRVYYDQSSMVTRYLHLAFVEGNIPIAPILIADNLPLPQ